MDAVRANSDCHIRARVDEQFWSRAICSPLIPRSARDEWATPKLFEDAAGEPSQSCRRKVLLTKLEIVDIAPCRESCCLGDEGIGAGSFITCEPSTVRDRIPQHEDSLGVFPSRQLRARQQRCVSEDFHCPYGRVENNGASAHLMRNKESNRHGWITHTI